MRELTDDSAMNTAQKQMWDNLRYDIRVDVAGNKYWYLNEKLHREDGPAIEYTDGSESWYVNGKLTENLTGK